MMTPNDYLTLYNQCRIDPKKIAEIEQVCTHILTSSALYLDAQEASHVPWPVIAVIHFRESNQNFNCHLHNGDPLSARTVHVPKNRPKMGKPPFTWAESAADALSETWRPSPAWLTASCLEFIERYNGCGYQKHGIHSPYLWDCTDQYSSGLFKQDGEFDPHAKENRPGAVALLKCLRSKGVSLDFAALGTRSPV